MSRRKMRKTIDFGRLRVAMSGPGSDSRSWCEMARVDDDPDAIQWIEGYGWVVDVTFTSGEVGGETEMPCRVLSLFGAPGNGSVCPVARGAEVVVMITSGDINVQPVIIGYLHNPTDAPLPTTVNGSTVNEGYAAATTVVVSDQSLDAQFGPNVRVSAATEAKLLAPQVKIADDAATQPFVRGNDVKSAIDSFAQALITAGAYTSSSPVVASAALISAVSTLASALTAALSTRIKGE
jgi:hypothetical protein